MSNKNKKIHVKEEKKETSKGLVIAIGAIIAVVVVIIIVLLVVPKRANNETSTISQSAADMIAEEISETLEQQATEEPIQEVAEMASFDIKSADDFTTETYADIEIENYGTIRVALNEEMAPISVENFVNLAEDGFYDGLTFHRIIEDFMMQGGDPNGDGTGGSGQNITGEFINNGVANTMSHTRGAISMARAMDMNSASSQFFIVHEDSTFLDGDYACFGYVTEGIDIVDQICRNAQPIDGNGSIMPDEQPIITSITVIRNP